MCQTLLADSVLHSYYISWICAKSQQISVVGLIFRIRLSKESFLCKFKSTVYIICKLVMSFTWVFIHIQTQRSLQKVSEYVFCFTTCHNYYKTLPNKVQIQLCKHWAWEICANKNRKIDAFDRINHNNKRTGVVIHS